MTNQIENTKTIKGLKSSNKTHVRSLGSAGTSPTYYQASGKLDTIIKIGGIAIVLIITFFAVSFAQAYLTKLRIQNKISESGSSSDNSGSNNSNSGNSQNPSTGAQKFTEEDVKRIINEQISIIVFENEIDPIFSESLVANITADNLKSWSLAHSWGNHALTGYLTDYSETDPVFSSSTSASITATNTSNWDTAYGWGNHADAGYLTAVGAETDPIFTASASAGITSTNITNWDTAFGWGNHATQGYLTSFTETDPIFGASASAGITSTNITNWNTAFGWGNHASQGYLTSYTETDPIFGASVAAGITSTNITNWDTAFGWGNHATQGYLTSFTETDPIFGASVASGITSTNITNWDTAFGWGNHASVGYLTAAITSLNGLTAATQTFATGTAGTDIGISSSVSTHTLNIPTASATNRGALSSTDWTTFNTKLGSTLTSANIFVGNISNVATSVALSGDATLSNTGVLSLANSGVVAGTYNNLTVDAKGRATGGSNVAYLTSYTETDPIFGASVAAGITSTNITNWDTAFGWGNHASAGYLTSVTMPNLYNRFTDGTNTATTASQTDIFRFVPGSNVTLTVGNDHVTFGDYVIINSSDEFTGTVTSITAGSGLSGGTISSSGTINVNSPSCSSTTQKLLWNGTDFICGTDQNTTYSAGTNLTLATTTFNLNSALTGISSITRSSGNLTISTTTSGDIILDSVGTVLIGATGTGKLDVGTIDPPYTINGEKFATYMPSMIGVKEELSGRGQTSEFIRNKGYKFTLNFRNQPKGSDLWLFARTADIRNNIDELSILLSPGSQTMAWYEIDEKNFQIHVYTTTPSSVSYRLTAPRFDAAKWSNTRDADAHDGFVLDYPESW